MSAYVLISMVENHENSLMDSCSISDCSAILMVLEEERISTKCHFYIFRLGTCISLYLKHSNGSYKWLY